MSSYLNIYLQKKRKDGKEEVERLKLCSISRSNELYSLFYDNNVGLVTDIKINHETLHEFTADDFDDISKHVDEEISRTLLRIYETKETLPLITSNEAVDEALENLASDKEYFRDLLNQKTTLSTLYFIFSDVGNYSDFDKLYWSID